MSIDAISNPVISDFLCYVSDLQKEVDALTVKNIELLSANKRQRDDVDRTRSEMLVAPREADQMLAHISELKAQIEPVSEDLKEARNQVRILVSEKKKAEHRRQKAETLAKQEAERADKKAERIQNQQ